VSNHETFVEDIIVNDANIIASENNDKNDALDVNNIEDNPLIDYGLTPGMGAKSSLSWVYWTFGILLFIIGAFIGVFYYYKNRNQKFNFSFKQ